MLGYRSNYTKTAVGRWFYSKDDAVKNAVAADDDNFKSFKYKTKSVGTTEDANGILEDAAIVVPLKYLMIFPDQLKFH